MSAGAHGGEKHLMIPWRWSYSGCELLNEDSIDCESSARAVCGAKHWDTSPAPGHRLSTSSPVSEWNADRIHCSVLPASFIHFAFLSHVTLSPIAVHHITLYLNRT